jgi:hypothetical protein
MESSVVLATVRMWRSGCLVLGCRADILLALGCNSLILLLLLTDSLSLASLEATEMPLFFALDIITLLSISRPESLMNVSVDIKVDFDLCIL